jgi:hypothetical protein
LFWKRSGREIRKFRGLGFGCLSVARAPALAAIDGPHRCARKDVEGGVEGGVEAADVEFVVAVVEEGARYVEQGSDLPGLFEVYGEVVNPPSFKRSTAFTKVIRAGIGHFCG